MQQLNYISGTREEEAIDWLRSNIGNRHVLVCFSGGKDSVVTEHLCEMAGLSYSLNSTLTGIDPPQVTQFIRKQYPTCSFVRPHLSFWHLLTTHNPPGGTGKGIKWCCTKIKERPSAVIPIKHRIMGIRAEESNTRAKYNRIDQVGDEVHYHPIFYWQTWEVFEFIERCHLPLPTLADGTCIYDHLDRVGCVICPNHPPGTHDIYRRLWPKHFECFERYVRIWWDKRVSQGREMYHGSPEEFLADWYRGKFFYYRVA